MLITGGLVQPDNTSAKTVHRCEDDGDTGADDADADGDGDPQVRGAGVRGGVTQP